jgi:1-aminocyclopropane-1-carboxylate deaminase/D-cysteine desulfhydrase-like pyridoxal-dependent ACC family enzyme
MLTLGDRFPAIAAALPSAGLARLPTPLTQHEVRIATRSADVWVKHDERCGALYGGNKVRKLDLVLARARERGSEAVATFGAVGSHHALATALYSRALGFDPVCFLGHQASTEHVREALAAHVANRTRIVRFGGTRENRIAVLREVLGGTRTCVVPAGGSSWLGTVGFVDAGLELANQLAHENVDLPLRLYVANGTMGTVAGLGLGLALANIPIDIQAVRVSSEAFANAAALRRLMDKTAMLLNRIDPEFPADLGGRARIAFRHDFIGDGYTRATPATEEAIRMARDTLGLTLETTYTAKAFAALLADAADPAGPDRPLLFWNTYSALPLPQTESLRRADTGLPEDFARYFT